MRRTPSFLMFLMIASVLAPAVALAQPPVVSEPTSSASFAGATTGHGRGLGIGTVVVFEPGAPGTPGSNIVPNILATWGDSRGRFHVDGLLGFDHTGSSKFDLGARGWYHVHAASSADLSVGMGLALVTYRTNGAAATPTTPAIPGSRYWDFEMDFGAQIRVFVVPNVALLAGLGLGLYFPDYGPSTVRLSGNIMNSLGLAYYFM